MDHTRRSLSEPAPLDVRPEAEKAFARPAGRAVLLVAGRHAVRPEQVEEGPRPSPGLVVVYSAAVAADSAGCVKVLGSQDVHMASGTTGSEGSVRRTSRTVSVRCSAVLRIEAVDTYLLSDSQRAYMAEWRRRKSCTPDVWRSVARIRGTAPIQGRRIDRETP